MVYSLKKNIAGFLNGAKPHRIMAIKNVEFLDDRIKVHYHFQQPEGHPDNRILNIPYGAVPKFPFLPKGYQGEEIYVKMHDKTLVLVPNFLLFKKGEDILRFWWYQIYKKEEPTGSPDLTELL